MKWWRQFKASWKSSHAPFEWGGLLCEYFPQLKKLEVIHKWETAQQMEEAHAIVQSMVDRANDQIFLATVKVGNSRGYFVVHGADGTQYERHFWDDLYPATEAYHDVQEFSKKLAKKYGFTSPGNFENYVNKFKQEAENEDGKV